MTTKYFNVKQGITTGNILLDGITGNITAANANIAGNIIAGNITTAGSGGNLTGANVISANTFIATITANVGNLNVTGLSNLGNVGNVTITGGSNGYYLQTNGSGGLVWAAVAGGTSIANGTSNVDIPTANGNINLTVASNTSLVVTSTGANISGTLDVTGNLTAGNIIAGAGSGGNISGANVITGNTIIATVTANVGNLNVTGLSNLGNVGNVTITGGSNGYYLQTNGSGALVWAAVPSGTGIANGNSNINIPTANGNINLTAGGNTTLIVTGTGGNISGTLDVTGNLTAGNITTSGASGNISGANVISANVFISSIATGTAPFTVTSTTQVANLNVATAGTASTVTANAQPNITSVGTLSSLSVTGTGSFGANVNMNSYNITSLAVPVNDSDAATKGYVDAVAQGIDTKEAVVYATTASIFGSGYTYNNGTSGVGATLTATSNGALSIDGSTPTAGDRVLIKNEVGVYVNTTTESAAFNGIYIVTQVGSASLPYILTRSVDFDTGSEIPGAFTFVSQGTTNLDTGWICTTNAPVIVGTTQILWSQFSSAGSYTAGTGLNLVGNQFNIANTAVTPASYGGGDAVATFTVNQQGQLTAASNTAITANAANLTGTTLNSTIITSSLTTVGTLTTLAVTGTSNLGNVGNVTITGGTNGYYLQTNGSGNLVWAPVASGTGIANGTSNVDIPTANGNINLTAGGNTSLVVTTTGGNISGTLDVTGNLTAGNITGANVISANTFVSNVTTGTAPFTVTSTTQVANLNVATAGTAGTVTTAAQPNITSVGTLTSLDVSGNVIAGNITTAGSGGNITGANVISANTFTATGNITAGNIITSGASGNISGANVITGNTIIATVTANVGNLNVTGLSNLGNVGNITITGGSNGYVLQTNGSGVLTWAAVAGGTGIANGTSNVAIPTANGNINLTAGGNTTLVVTDTGANITGTANISGNLVAGNIIAGGGSGGNITGANVISANTFIASGNITANYVAFNGGLTSNRSNVVVTTNTVIDQFAPGTFRTAKYIISASGDDGFQSVETLLVHDGSTAYITIYGSICSNNSADIIDISSNVNGVSGNVALYATGTSANLKVNMISTYIKT